MQFGNLGAIERKVLGAMLILADREKVVKTTMKKLAETMGYKSSGGALNLAIQILERDNFIVKESEGRFRVLV
jgi:hypothetical protein